MTRHPSNYDLLADLEANIAHAAWIEAHIDDWTGPLRAIATDTGRVAGNNHGGETDDDGQGGDTHADPVGNAATRGYDPTRVLAESAQAQLADLARLRVIAGRMNARRNGTLNRIDLEQAKSSVTERTTPSTVGWCEACPTHCTGASKYESLIGKLCGACRQALQRWPKTADPGADRAAFIRHRRVQTQATAS